MGPNKAFFKVESPLQFAAWVEILPSDEKVIQYADDICIYTSTHSHYRGRNRSWCKKLIVFVNVKNKIQWRNRPTHQGVVIEGIVCDL